jgi:hypothetical protein
MNLATTLTIYGGGPGSGCRGPNCGRPSIGGKEQAHVVAKVLLKGSKYLYHGTSSKSIKRIKNSGLVAGKNYVTPFSGLAMNEASFKVAGTQMLTGKKTRGLSVLVGYLMLWCWTQHIRPLLR